MKFRLEPPLFLFLSAFLQQSVGQQASLAPPPNRPTAVRALWSTATVLENALPSIVVLWSLGSTKFLGSPRFPQVQWGSLGVPGALQSFLDLPKVGVIVFVSMRPGASRGHEQLHAEESL